MSSNTSANLAGLTPKACFNLLNEHRRCWLLPTVVCSVLALGYAMVMTRYWEASQGLIVRPEVTSLDSRVPGKFNDLYEMRTFQETILELGKSQQVIVATIKAVEQAETGQSASEPSAEKIESLRERMSLLPPGGAEFGKTEICYLNVKDKNRELALKYVGEFGRQINQRLQTLKAEQAQSLSSEIEQQVKLAQTALEAETARLAKFEAKVGADLGELRMLNASFSGQSDLRQQAIRLKGEQLTVSSRVRQSEQLLVVLNEAVGNPKQLIAMPSSLLESQPTLRGHKEGLVAAQLRLARLEGTRTAEHPQVQSALASVQFIRKGLHQELEVAIRGVEVELQLERNRLVRLDEKYLGVQQRLGNLAQLRAGYANRISAVENSRLVLDQAQKQLGATRAKQVVESSTRLITSIDQPVTGAYPGGPGRASIVLLGTFGGFAIGIGWLFLTVVPKPTEDEVLGSVVAQRSTIAEPVVVRPLPTEVAVPEIVVAETVSETATGFVDETVTELAVEQTIDPIIDADVLSALSAVAPSIQRNIPSSLPPAVAVKIAEIIASRDTLGSQEAQI